LVVCSTISSPPPHTRIEKKKESKGDVSLLLLLLLLPPPPHHLLRLLLYNPTKNYTPPLFPVPLLLNEQRGLEGANASSSHWGLFFLLFFGNRNYED